MPTKMVIYLPNGTAKVLEFRTHYTDIKIIEGILYVYRDTNVMMIFAKGFWSKIEFNRSDV